MIGRAVELAEHAPTPLTANISAASIASEASQRLILERVSSARLPAGRLILEVTETAAITNCATARAFAERLRDVGCSLALDDFGVAHASCLSLKQLPFDHVKIDGSFVRNITRNRMDRVFVEAIGLAAKRLGKRTIASSVEAISLLRDLGIDMAQAYILGEPRPTSVAFAACPDRPDSPALACAA